MKVTAPNIEYKEPPPNHQSRNKEKLPPPRLRTPSPHPSKLRASSVQFNPKKNPKIEAVAKRTFSLPAISEIPNPKTD